MSLFVPDVAVTEKIVRSVAVYVFLLIAFRVAGKRRERLSLPELHAALRQEGVTSIGQVRWAILEEDGKVSVIPRAGAR